MLPKFVLRILIPLSWAVIIAYLSLMPQRSLPHPHWFNFENSDKLVHLAMYAKLAAVMYRAALIRTTVSIRSLLLIVMICGVFGLFIEVMQERFTSDRTFDWIDALFNVIGAGVSAGVCKLLPNKIFLSHYKI